MNKLMHATIRKMKQAGVDIGTRVEILMKEGAERHNDYCIDPKYVSIGIIHPGYLPSEKKELKGTVGLSGIGYISKFEPEGITLVPIHHKKKGLIGEDGFDGFFFIHGDVIHSYTILQA